MLTGGVLNLRQVIQPVVARLLGALVTDIVKPSFKRAELVKKKFIYAMAEYGSDRRIHERTIAHIWPRAMPACRFLSFRGTSGVGVRFLVP